MAQRQKLLFVCDAAQRRSVTAESLFRGAEGYEARSAGTERGARVRVKQEDVEWADLIFVMEQHQLQKVRAQFKSALKGKRLICLQIPDRYGGMSLDLIEVLKDRLGAYIAVPHASRA